MPDAKALTQRIMAALQAGRSAEAKAAALDWQRQAPQSPEALFWLATAHLSLGEAAAALPLLERVARVAPGHADTHNNLGVALRQLGRPAEAIPRFRRALELAPRHAEAHESLAQLLRAAGDLENAGAHFLAAVQNAPSFRSAWFGLAETLRALGRLGEAATVYQQFLQAYPKDHYALNNLGVVVQQQGGLEEAATLFRRAVEVAPDYADALSHLAAALHDLGRNAEALEPARRAHQLRPDAPHIANNLAIVLLAVGGALEAEAALRNAVARAPDYFDAQHNYANALHALGETERAITHLRDLLARHPGHESASFNLSTMLLTEGRFAEGWPLYEHRSAPWRQRLTTEPWDGQRSLAGKTLLLHAEQGLGDTLQFLRYAPLLAARGARVVLEVQRPLLPVLARLAGAVTVVAKEEAPPAHDEHLPLLSAPARLGTGADTLPPPGPWVSVPEERLQHWAPRFASEPRLKVGVVWSGNPRHRNDLNRSLPLSLLAPAFATLPIAVYSLQKEVRAADAPTLQTLTDWVHLGPELADFADTAAILAHLDLVVTVDTSVAHLAAALGKPTWILLPEPPDWRWLRGRTDSPWYPAVTLFRQEKAGGWDVPLQGLHEALANHVKSVQPRG